MIIILHENDYSLFQKIENYPRKFYSSDFENMP